MNYTQTTTIEQYQAWLATFPPISQIRRVTRLVYKGIYKSLNKILALIQKPTRSCLRPMGIKTTIPASYTNYPRPSAYNEWMEYVCGQSQQESPLDQYRRERMLEYVEHEIQMEQLFQTAVKSLIN